MPSIRRFALAAALLALTGCRTVSGDSARHSDTPCPARRVAAVLNTDEPLTRDEVRYLEGCGIRFTAPPAR